MKREPLDESGHWLLRLARSFLKYGKRKLRERKTRKKRREKRSERETVRK
jgi:hypothetical protein